MSDLNFGASAAVRVINRSPDDYFVESDAFRCVESGKKALVLGNRDMGKSAIQAEVHELLASGAGEAATVRIQRPADGRQRLRVAGEPRWGGARRKDDVASECGFASGYIDERHQQWSTAFAYVDAATYPPSEAREVLKASDDAPELAGACPGYG